ncbi:MAG TPA: SRPBCC domain-containing protein [Vicinamibacteria bacterium]|nr:SRPBCC domain-containing protein [Vicinamibacteria bacterium]
MDVRPQRHARGLETYTFEEADGKTTLVAVGHFDSIESRDAAIASGMEKGAAEMWDRLEELLRTLR